MLAPLEVIWIFDGTTSPPKSRMVCCIHIGLGLFFRITTKPWQTALPLRQIPDHPFLRHDSYLECGEPLEIDDYTVDTALRRKGVVGKIATHLVPDILTTVDKARTISLADKAAIRQVLEALLPRQP